MTENTEPTTDPTEVPDPEPAHENVEPWDAERAAAEGVEVDTQPEPAATEPPDAS